MILSFALLFFEKDSKGCIQIVDCQGVVQLGDEVQGIDGDPEALSMLPSNFH